jgi:hypothetical protein
MPEPIGSPVSGGGATPPPAKPGKDAGAAGKDAAAAGMAAAKAFAAGGGGPVKIEHTGPGFPVGAVISGGLNIVKANLVPSLALAGPFVLVAFLGVVAGLAARFGPASIASMIGTIFGIVGGLFGLAMLAFPQVLCNYMAGVKEFQASGKKIGIKDLIKFDNIVQRYITLVIVGFLTGLCFGLPGLVLHWAVPLIVDKPHVGFANALKASIKYGPKAIVPTLIFGIVLGVINMVGSWCCAGLTMFITFPMGIAAHWLIYELKRDEITAAAAEGGITL